MIDIIDYMKLPLCERQKHLNLEEECLERGGMSTYFKGMMAHILNTTIPSGMKVHVCHACGNNKCSNPKHLYFGSPKENVADGYRHGTMVSAWQATVNKHGLERARQIARNSQKMNCGRNTFYITNGKQNKRLPIGSEIPENWRKGRTLKLYPCSPSSATNRRLVKGD